MFKLTDENGIQWRVAFRYAKDYSGKRRLTHCSITDLESGTEYGGFAMCSKDDQFVKAVGRKLALADALTAFDRPFRKMVWNAYWDKLTERRYWVCG